MFHFVTRRTCNVEKGNLNPKPGPHNQVLQYPHMCAKKWCNIILASPVARTRAIRMVAEISIPFFSHSTEHLKVGPASLLEGML